MRGVKRKRKVIPFRSPYLYGLEHIVTLHLLIGRDTPMTAPRLTHEHAIEHDAETYMSYTTKRMEEIS